MATRLEGYVYSIRSLLNQESRRVGDDAIVDAIKRAGLAYFGTLIGSLNQYQPGRAVPLVSAQLTERVTLELQPFQVEQTITATGGLIPKPASLAYLLNLTARYSGGKDEPDTLAGVTEVTEQRWNGRVTSLIAPPSEDAPIGRVTPSGWEIRPVPVAADVVYYGTPRDPKLVLQLDSNGEPILDPVTDEPLVDDTLTVDVQWLPLSDAEIIRRACEMLGLRTSDRPAQEFARVTKQEPS